MWAIINFADTVEKRNQYAVLLYSVSLIMHPKYRLIICLVLPAIFLFCSLYAQPDNVYGRWKCVKMGMKGYQKYDSNKARRIEHATLVISPHEFYYSNIKFVEKCSFDTIILTAVDTLFADIMARIYTSAELKKMQEVQMIDRNREHACFNDCARFYLKEDTLINICGGYQYYLKKIK